MNPIDFRRIDFSRAGPLFDQALDRLAEIGIGARRDPARLDVKHLPPPDVLARLIADIASVWRGHHRSKDRRDPGAQPVDSPEALVSFAADNDVDVVFENRSIATLGNDDLPAVMMTKDARGRMLVTRRGRSFIAYHAGQSYFIDKDALAAEEAGTLFLVRPRGHVPADNIAELVSSVASSDFVDPVRGILGYMTGRHRKLVLQLVVAAAFSNMMLLALPVYSGLIFDRVIPHSAFDTLWAISIGVTLALTADIAVRWVRFKLQDALASSASAAIQASVMRKLLEAKMAQAPRAAGTILVRLRNLDGMTQLLPQAITGVVVDIPFLLIVFGLLWLNGGPTVLAPVAGIAVLIGVNHWAMSGTEAEQKHSNLLTQVQTNRLNETVEVLETIKSTRSELQVLNRFERVFDEFAYSSHLVRLWHGLAAYANVSIGQLMVVLVLVIGACEVSAGNMTIGGLTTCSLLVGRIIMPIGQIVGVMHRMLESRSLLKSLSGEQQYDSETAGDASGALRAPVQCPLRLHNVSFAYSGQSARQIDDVSLSIKPGERIAIVGRSGSGKSTLLRLMARFAEPDRGSILLDGFDVRQYAPGDLRQVIGYMGQSPGLVDETLMDNIKFGQTEVDPARFETVVKLTGVADFAAVHPNGFGMRVGPRGERLSGGERQSVALARVLLADPRVLLLDEPTSSIDTMLEMRLVRNLKQFLGDRTLIVATHRAPILQLVDRIIWLESGRIMADGPKDEVLKRMSGAAA
jgi:ATP-binding cassette, subfamily C, bacterial LapB